ncbi:MAG: hypothetical protein JWO60_2618, partial [Frankiales bacterium]|nr:hypothetical protein [Frankiales bacterium]
LSADAGRLSPGAASASEVPGGALHTSDWGFVLPDAASGLWRTTGPPDAVEDAVPFSSLASSQGETGLAVRSGAPLRTVLGGTVRAGLVSFAVQRGQEFTVLGAGPVDGAPLYLWAPSADRGAASSYDEPVERVDLRDGPVRYRASLAGRYVLGHLLAEGQEAGTYEVQVRYPEPVGRVTAASVSTTGTAGLPFRVAWSGASRYDVQWMVRSRTSSGWASTPWRTWLRDTTATTAVFGAGGSPTTVTPGTTYHLRVVPYDGLGGVGQPSPSTAVSVPYDDTTVGLRYSAGWQSQRLADRYQGTLHATPRAGSRATVAAEGSAFSLVAERSPSSGQVDVLLDGVRRARVDLGSASVQHRAVVWTSGPLPGGIRRHVVELVVVGTRGRPQVTLDGVAAHR